MTVNHKDDVKLKIGRTRVIDDWLVKLVLSQ